MDQAQLEKRISDGTLCTAGPDGLPQLCGNALRELILPPTLQRAGRYCFYNCEHLQKLEFWNGLTDWGSGVFTGCHQMHRIRLHLNGTEQSMLKEVLDEVPETLRVEYLTEGQEDASAVLIFPEFYEEGVENTPARILETHVHGSGIRYRNCFQGRSFDFQQYDRIFPYAQAQESFEVVAELVTGRLWYPYRLQPEARSQYEAFAVQEREQFGTWIIQRKDMRGLAWLTGLAGGHDPGFLAYLTNLAGQNRFAEAVSYLMEQGHQQQKKRKGAGRRRMEL
jgi:hypothetical protein